MNFTGMVPALTAHQIGAGGGDVRIHSPVTLAADVGGTFTDIVMRTDDGSLAVRKVPSSPPGYHRAVLEGAAPLLAGDGRAVDRVVHGTTVATNAILERDGARTALITTAGFRDVLELRRMRIPHLHDLLWVKPPPLVPRDLRFELHERVRADGTVEQPLDDDDVLVLAKRIATLGVESLAVCLLHSYRFPEHEERAGAILRDALPDVAVSLSVEIQREQGEYERTAAAVVNAYVVPLMRRYVEALDSGLRDHVGAAPLELMQSSGGLMSAARATQLPVFALESGPAAALVAARAVAASLGIEDFIAFEMGGTTAKASLVEGGALPLSREYEVGSALSAGSRLMRGAGELMRIPSIDIAEVGAGGGSIAWVDEGGALQVGPRSAGAEPGPACYGRGGQEATVTDANVVLGLIPPGPLGDGEISVCTELATAAVSRVAAQLGSDPQATALAIHELANARMMRAVQAVTSERGRDPREFAIVAAGGSGPIHALGIAEELGVDTVIVPPHAGVASAAGLLFARPSLHDVRFCDIDAKRPDVAALGDLVHELTASLRSQWSSAEAAAISWSLDLRYRGQNWDLEIPVSAAPRTADAVADGVRRFYEEYRQVYGVVLPEAAAVVLRAVRAELAGATPPASIRIPDRSVPAGAVRSLVLPSAAAAAVEVPILARAAIGPAARSGPMVIDEYDTTVVVRPGWTVERDPGGAALVLRRVGERAAAGHDDVVVGQVLRNALAAVADDMATTVFRTAHSTIVRDVMDYAAALCDRHGATIAQAVTLPLMLGSLPAAMRRLVDRFGDAVGEGDVYLMNDPFDGGMHTNDLYVAKPVFRAGAHIGYAVTVAHHSDFGGRVPGTIAADNTEVFQEGLRLPWIRYAAGGATDEGIERILRANVRLPEVSSGDLASQLAACNIGERGLQALADRHGVERFLALCADLLDHDELLARRAIKALPDGQARFVDYLDHDGIDARPVPIVAEVTIEGDRVVVDLREAAPMTRGALNCTRGVTEAMAYHAVLSTIGGDAPNSGGAFRPIEVLTKPGTVTDAVPPAASSMRGVTAYRTFDAVVGALARIVPDRLPAANEGGPSLAFFSGTDAEGRNFVYCDAVLGAWGGSRLADGNDGIGNPCSPTANVPVEVAEAEFPVVVDRYALVPDSGGAGRRRGGLAVERAWRWTVPSVALQVRSDRRDHRPYGLQGGRPGTASANELHRRDGRVNALPPMLGVTLDAGELFVHRTAGAGGWGHLEEREPNAVVHDVALGKISPRHAYDAYGIDVQAAAGSTSGPEEMR